MSLAQILLSLLTFEALHLLDVPTAFNLIATYLAFCFSPLFPVLPVKIKIKIYPPLVSETSETIREEMNEIMNRSDVPHGKRQVYPLNSIERFMLLNENPEVFYNSHFVFDFYGALNRDHFLKTTERWIESLPQVRSIVETGFWRSQRFSYEKAWFKAQDIVTFDEGISQEKVDKFCQQKFDLAFMPAVRLLVLTENGKNRVVFSCHHSLFDGAAQAFAFEEWSRIYNGDGPSSKYQKIETFRYRNLMKHFGWKESLKLLLENFQTKPPRMKINVATLAQPENTTTRKVKSRILKIRVPSSLREDFYQVALKSMHKTLEDVGDSNNPIVAYMPVGLRFFLKVKNSLQNVVVSHTFFAKRSIFRDDSLSQKLESRLKSDPIRANSKFFFGCLPLCALGNENKVRTAFNNLDKPTSPITSSVLLVSAPIPRHFKTPQDWSGLFISARGTLIQSPSVGLIYTGKLGFETITIEYVETLVPEESIDRLQQNLIEELGMEMVSHGSLTYKDNVDSRSHSSTHGVQGTGK